MNFARTMLSHPFLWIIVILRCFKKNIKKLSSKNSNRRLSFTKVKLIIDKKYTIIIIKMKIQRLVILLVLIFYSLAMEKGVVSITLLAKQVIGLNIP